MKTKVFISRPHQGWTEIQLPDVYTKLSYEKLVNRVHIYLKQYSYKGVLITQNPAPCLLSRDELCT
jgi:hypothetical protein